jgi:hypothetical protein
LLTTVGSGRSWRKTAPAGGFDRRQALIVQHDWDIQLRFERQGLGDCRRCSRTPIPRQRQRQTDDDQTGAELRHERGNRTTVCGRLAASSDHRTRSRKHTLRIAHRHADTPFPKIDADHSRSRRRSRHRARLRVVSRVGQADAEP